MIIVKGRELLIPRDDYNIGTNYDSNVENRQFSIPRITSGGTDLSNLTFNLDIRYYNDGIDTAVLEKEVSENSIVLTWEIRNGNLQVPGAVIIQIRATDSSGMVKWSSYEGAVFVEDAINVPASYTGSLTELEQLEESVRGVLTSEASRVTAENARAAAETERQSAEEERIAAEALRASAETARDDSFNASQNERSAEFNDAETLRQESYLAGEKARNDAYEIAETGRDNTYGQAEGIRQVTFEKLVDQFNEERSGLTNLVSTAVRAASNATTSESHAKTSETNAKESELLAKQYAEDAGRFTPSGYQALVADVGAIKTDLGDKSDASKVTGLTAFAKIAALKSLIDQATPEGYDKLVDDVKTLKSDVQEKIDDPTSKSDGQVLTYNATSGAWVAEDSEAKGTKYITQAEYDALTDAEKNDGTIYCINDSTENPFDVSASMIPYDNTESGLAAEDVQSAIDEANINALKIGIDNEIIDISGITRDGTAREAILQLSENKHSDRKRIILRVLPNVVGPNNYVRYVTALSSTGRFYLGHSLSASAISMNVVYLYY